MSEKIKNDYDSFPITTHDFLIYRDLNNDVKVM